MEELDMSSCSFATDNEEQLSAPQDQLASQQAKMENEHLQEVNKQLLGSIEALKQQLKDAMEAAATVNGMNDTIAQLKSQLAESKEKEKNYVKELKNAAAASDASNQKQTKETADLQQQLEESKQKLCAEVEHVSKLKKEKQNLISEINQKSNVIENMAMELNDARSCNKKMRTKLISIAEKLQESESELLMLKLKLQEEENEKSTLIQDIDALKIEITTRQTDRNESASSISLLKKELNDKNAVISSLEEQFDAQHNEIEEVTLERHKIVSLIQKMHAALSASENKVESIKKENNALIVKANKAAKKGRSTSSNDLSSLTLPFEGDIGEKVNQLIKLPQYQPTQRIQLVINEVAKRLSELESSIKTKSDECTILQNQLEQTQNGQIPYCQILDSLLRELKNISCAEAKINNANLCKVDTQFIEFMAEKSAQIEPLIRDELLNDPRFIPSDFFTTNDPNKRKGAIMEIIKCSDISYTIFTSQFLTNILLTTQLNALMGPLGKMEEISRLDCVGGDFNDIPNLLKSLQQKINSLKKTRKQLHDIVKKQQNAVVTLCKSENELKTKVSHLQIANDSLQSEIDVLKVKYQIASNELLLKTNEEHMSQFAAKIRENVNEQQNETKQETEKLENELQQKTKECCDLTTLIKKLQISLDESTRKQNKKYQRTEDTLKNQISEMQQQIEYLEQQIVGKKKDAKRNECSLRQQYEKTIEQISSQYEVSKVGLIKTIDELKEKAAQAREMIRKMQQNLDDVEAKNRKLAEENIELCKEKKAFNAQQLAMKQQIAKDKQNLQIQLSAQLMACDNKTQSLLQDAKVETEKNLKNLYDLVVDNLGSFYGYDDSDFNEDSLKQVISHAKEDLGRLQYFQNEATKY